MQDFVIDLIKELEAVKASQKKLSEQETDIKGQLHALLAGVELDSFQSDYGTVRIQRRQEKDYGPEIRAMEIDLKERKKLAEDLGDYTIIGTKESIVFTPPKDVF